jgi:ribonuclease BN (tRNA processing enzyme)
MACALASAAGVKRLALFHHDPNHDDETVHDLEEQAQAIFAGAFSAREGQEMALSVGTLPIITAGQLPVSLGVK